MMFKDKFNAWIMAMRLRTIPLSISGMIIGAVLAIKAGKFSFVICILSICTTILLQIVSNFANDYGDAMKGTDNTNRIGPIRAIQSGQIKPKAMQNAIVITSLLAFFGGSSLILYSHLNYIEIIGFIFLGLFSIWAAIRYTVGKKAYGYMALGDIFVFLFFGWVSVLGIYYIYTQSFEWKNMLPASTIGLLSTGVLNLNNLRDIENDKQSNKNTLAVKLGYQNAKIYQISILLLALFLLYVYQITIAPIPTWISSLYLIPSIYIYRLCRHVYQAKNHADFDPLLKQLALITFFISILFGIIVLL